MVCVMVVEDENDVREILVDVLTDAGFEIVEAATADVAVALLQQDDIRLIVTDIDMPGLLDGIALAKAARQWCPTIPVVFISGRPARLEEAKSTVDPAEFFSKPFRLAKLVADVERLTVTQGIQSRSRCEPNC